MLTYHDYEGSMIFMRGIGKRGFSSNNLSWDGGKFSIPK